MAGTLHYVNADFDLSLRARPRKIRQASMRRAADAMTVQGLLLGGAGDAVLVRAGVPAAFVDYLVRSGIEVPGILRHPHVDPAMRFRPFGWNEEALALNRRMDGPAPHPGLETVRRVNSRAFSSRLEREHFGGEDGGVPFTSVSGLSAWLGAQEERQGGWVVKADHGNAALGNRRLRRRKLSDADRRFAEGLLAEDDVVFVEPWRDRLSDLCAVFELDRKGAVVGRRIHETIYTGDGALIGALFEKGATQWRTELFGAMEVIAAELSRLGYFGPVCFDSFVHRTSGGKRLRPLADLNCRQPMSDGAFRLWGALSRERALLWRFFNTGKMRRAGLDGIADDEGHFSPSRQEGFLLTSPREVEIEGKLQRAPKLSAAFIGRDRERVLSLETRFRERYER